MSAPTFNPRDRIRVADHDGELIVYTVARIRPPMLCVIVDGAQKWFSPDSVIEHHPAELIDWQAGDRFALRSGDGRVIRHGTLLEWIEAQLHWFVVIDAMQHPTDGYQMPGLKTWLRAAELVPVEG